MAVADMLVSLFIMPFSIKFLYHGQKWLSGGLGSLTCKFVNFSGHVSIAASIIALVAISLDRYFAILHPFKHLPLIRNTKLVTTLIWLASSVFMIPYLVLYNSTRGIDDRWRCHLDWNYISKNGQVQLEFAQAYFLVTIFCLFIIPLCIIATIYTLIGFRLWSRQIPGQTNEDARRKAEKSKKKVLRMLTIVVTAFTLCWFPVHLMHFLTYFYIQKYLNIIKQYPHLEASMYFLGHTNSAINPCLYVLLNERFKREFLNIVCFCSSGKKYFQSTTDSFTFDHRVKETETRGSRL